MRLAFIGCNILTKEANNSIFHSENFVHSFWLEQGLHNTPKKLQEKIQQTIDEIEALDLKQKENFAFRGRGFDAIVLGYGLCSNGVIGLTSKRLPIITPRCDDCIALFLGSQQRYLDIFNNNKGIYWYSKAWMDNGCVPSKEWYKELHARYTEAYDEDTADFLIETETSFITDYSSLFFIKSSLYSDDKEQARSKEIATSFDWEYSEVEDDISFINDLINGNWDDEQRFLICQPNQTIVADYTGLKIKAE